MVLKRMWLGIILLSILAVMTGSSFIIREIQERSSTTTTLSSPSSEIEIKPPPRKICLETGPVDASWPIDAALLEWNRQFIVQLVIDTDNCFAVVPFVVRSIPGKWGETVNDHGKWSVGVSPEVPPVWRQHVLCHEFGHLLGLGHTAEVDSCMNIQLTYPRPSKLNLQEAGKNLWMFVH